MVELLSSQSNEQLCTRSDGRAIKSPVVPIGLSTYMGRCIFFLNEVGMMGPELCRAGTTGCRRVLLFLFLACCRCRWSVVCVLVGVILLDNEYVALARVA